ncbi:MAG TPA: hypothetical protein VKC90_03810 [Chitinophagaceae bacterium]|nr:hypothetical protein [Chitinophagaceae bacterium]
MKKLFTATVLLLFIVFSAQSQSAKSKLKLVNFNEVEKNKAPGHPIIYLTGNQWKEYTKDAVRETYDEKLHKDLKGFKVISLGDDPFSDGVLMFGRPCAPGCDEDSYGFCHCNERPDFKICQPSIGRCSGTCTLNRSCRMVVIDICAGVWTVACRCQ